MLNDPTDIYMWRRLDPSLTTSGQPSEDQLAALRAIGVTHIVNLGLHSHEKALPDEAASVSALGMTYIHIPVDFAHPTDQDFERFCSAMQELAGHSVHVHCIANLRVSAFIYRYRRDVLAMPADEARQEMDRIWRPGGVWAGFIGDEEAVSRDHLYARRDY
nr:protein tyrosine phosphatase family protein [Sphingobium sp. Sx8-8]